MEGLGKSFGYAFEGVVHILKRERNARIHLLFALIVLVMSLVLRVGAERFAALFFAILVVFVAEIFNTAIEKVLDLLHPERHAQVKEIKDMAAGAVLVSALAAVVIGVVVFTPYVVALWAQ